VILHLHRIITGEFEAAGNPRARSSEQSKAIDDQDRGDQFDKPYSIFYESLAGRFEGTYIVPVGYNPKKPIGTGPFKLRASPRPRKASR